MTQQRRERSLGSGSPRFAPHPAQALVLEDDGMTRDRARDLIHSLGLDVHATDSVATAEAWVRLRPAPYSLAVIDWDMSRSPDADGAPSPNTAHLTAAAVLNALSDSAPWAPAVVWAGRLGVVATQAAISQAHPRALLQDKSLGEAALVGRVRSLLSARVGDIDLDRGMVRHIPSGGELINRIAVTMLLAFPHWVYVPSYERAQQGLLFRFRRWLREVDSTVEVASVRARSSRYTLRVRGEG